MIFEAIVAILVPISVLIVGLALLVFSSDRAVKHSISFASAMGASPLMIGLILVSIGTDLPEVANSIIASTVGMHACMYCWLIKYGVGVIYQERKSNLFSRRLEQQDSAVTIMTKPYMLLLSG